MQIQIVYQTWDAADPVCKFLTPEEYFDPLEPGESFEADGIPRYNHTWQYLDVPVSGLKWTTLQRSGTTDDTTFRTQYMDDGQSWMTHRYDRDGYEEIIHFTQTDAVRCHILRTFREAGGGWVVCLNSIIEDMADGSQTEQRFDHPWSPDDARNYGRLG